MICPKCKNNIDKNILNCNVCGTKIGAYCKDCGAYNLITSKICSNCGKELIKICSNCGAANLPNTDRCRKCGEELTAKEFQVTQNFVNSPEKMIKTNSQQAVKSSLTEGLKNPDIKIISLVGESGSGKSLIVKSVINELSSAKVIWLAGTCTQITQLTPLGYIQDLLLNFFNINNFCTDTLQLKKNSIKFFKQDFSTLTNSEVLDLLNLLYPESLDIYENIYFNKAKTLTMLKKVFITIVEKMKTIFVIDKFEYIDGMSLDLIKELLKEDLILQRAKFLIMDVNLRPGMGFIPADNLEQSNYLDLAIAPFSEVQTSEFLKQCSDKNFSPDFVKLVNKTAKGNPADIEQIVLFRNDISDYGLKNVKAKTLDAVIETRLNILKEHNYSAYRFLVAASVLGVKFYPLLLETFDNNSTDEFENILRTLVNSGFIVQINNLSFEFKTISIWRMIVAIVKNDVIFEEILNIIYELTGLYKFSSIALNGYIAQKINNYEQAFQIWTILMKQAAYIGDIGLYVISQKQALKLIENKNTPQYRKIKKNIYTRVGKLLEPIDYQAAFDYLQNAVMFIEDWEDAQHIDLLAYIASCSMKAGNYFGVIECVDNVINKLPSAMSIEKTLIKTRLIKPLLRLGNYGQLINIVETELLPELELLLGKNRDLAQIKLADLFELWLSIYLDFAEALIFQGNSRSFDVIRTIYEIIEKNKIDSSEIHNKINLLLALANTVKGDLISSKKILNDMLKDFSLENAEPWIISRWNFIDILNKFFEQDYQVLKTELFEVVAYANNIDDVFTKNIMRTLLAKVLDENNQGKKALEILEEQVSYFAKEKVATGVLFSWYLISKLKLQTNNATYAMDIALKALDIAQSTNIDNYYFTILFNKLIGEAYVAKQDFESAKVYFEKAIFLAKQFNLEYLLVMIYIQEAKMYQELALPKTNNRMTYIKQAFKIYQTAKNVSIVADTPALQKNIKDELSILIAFCKLNRIILKNKNLE